MDAFSIGSLNTYTKNLKLQTQWNMKKQSGDVTSHTNPMEQRLKSSAVSDTTQDKNEDKNKLNTIMQKVYAGTKLTDDEKQYLQAKDPMTYQKLRSMEQEEKSYEQELKKCLTKEDVQRLKMSKVGSALANAKAIANDPAIPQEKKLQMLQLENARCNKLEERTRKFIKSGEYEQLPTEAEESKAREEIKETGKVEIFEQPGQQEQSQSTAQDKSQTEAVPSDMKSETVDKPKINLQTEQESHVEVESPEARKVRRAKAKAAYTAPPVETVSYTHLTLPTIYSV